METKTQVQIINDEINRELSDPRTMNALLATTFKGLDATKMKQAITEGMIRGFTFKNFLQKDIYAVPFSSGYTLITSIDFSRKIGMKSGIVGKDAPVYEEKDGKIISCSVTVYRKVSDYVGKFTATVFFAEYTTGRNLWLTKPRTMIAKVAEMHALRMACPEELSQQYIEEEMEVETIQNTRFTEAQQWSESLKMKNLVPHETKNSASEENQDGITDAEGDQSASKGFKENTIKRD